MTKRVRPTHISGLLLCTLIIMGPSVSTSSDAAGLGDQPKLKFSDQPVRLTLSQSFEKETSRHFFFDDHPTHASLTNFTHENAGQEAQDLFVLGNLGPGSCVDNMNVFLPMIGNLFGTMLAFESLGMTAEQKTAFPPLCEEALSQVKAGCAKACNLDDDKSTIAKAVGEGSCAALGKAQGQVCDDWVADFTDYCESYIMAHTIAGPQGGEYMCNPDTQVLPKEIWVVMALPQLCASYMGPCGDAQKIPLCQNYIDCAKNTKDEQQCTDGQDFCLNKAEQLPEAQKLAAKQACNDTFTACQTAAMACYDTTLGGCTDQLLACEPFNKTCESSNMKSAKDCAEVFVDFVKDGAVAQMCPMMSQPITQCADAETFCGAKPPDQQDACFSTCHTLLTTSNFAALPVGHMVMADVRGSNPAQSIRSLQSFDVSGVLAAPYAEKYPVENSGWKIAPVHNADGLDGFMTLVSKPTSDEIVKKIAGAAGGGGGPQMLLADAMGKSSLLYVRRDTSSAPEVLRTFSQIALNGGSFEPPTSDGSLAKCSMVAKDLANPGNFVQMTPKALFDKGCLSEVDARGVAVVNLFGGEDVVVLNGLMPAEFGNGAFVTIYRNVDLSASAKTFNDLWRYEQFLGPLPGRDLMEAAPALDGKSLFLTMNAPSQKTYFVYRIFMLDGKPTFQAIPVGTTAEWGGLGPYDIATLDATHDGQTDFVITLARPPSLIRPAIYAPSLYLFVAQADGSYLRHRLDAPKVFDEPLNVAAIPQGESEQGFALQALTTVAAHDFDGDGFPEIVAGDHTAYEDEAGKRLIHAYLWTNTGSLFDTLSPQILKVNADLESTLEGVCQIEVDQFGNIGALMNDGCFPPPEAPAQDPQAGAQQAFECKGPGFVTVANPNHEICCQDLDFDGHAELAFMIDKKLYAPGTPESLDENNAEENKLKTLAKQACDVDNCSIVFDMVHFHELCLDNEAGHPVGSHACYNQQQADTDGDGQGDVCPKPVAQACEPVDPTKTMIDGICVAFICIDQDNDGIGEPQSLDTVLYPDLVDQQEFGKAAILRELCPDNCAPGLMSSSACTPGKAGDANDPLACANADQADADGDGHGDVCDKEPNESYYWQ